MEHAPLVRGYRAFFALFDAEWNARAATGPIATKEETMTNSEQLQAAGWKYDEQQKRWTAPNGFLVELGFAEEVSTAWNPQDYPLENEQHCDQLELSNPDLGSGSRQRFRMTTL
jgi:hypothetical protein